MSYDYSFPFDWDLHFVPDKATDCMPACIAMAARYWSIQRPDLQIPTDLATWKKFIVDQKGMTMRGASLTRVFDNLSKTMHAKPSQNLKIVPIMLMNTESTIEFISQSPPIPLILIFDRSYMITNNQGGYHACLLYGVDYKKEKKLAVVDPNLVDSRDPFPWDLKFFAKGWGQTENACLAVFPPDMFHLDIEKIGTKVNSLTGFMEEYR